MNKDNVALVGKFGSGKTTIASHLIEHFGYTQVSFARRLKIVATSVYGKPMPNGSAQPFMPMPIDKSDEYEVGDRLISGRQLLQEFGQVVKSLDKMFWVKWALRDIEFGVYGQGPFIIDDCRFPYEADALRERGFLIVRIETPEQVRLDRYEQMYGRRPTANELNHPSETEVDLIKPDLIVDGQASPDYNMSRIQLRLEGLAEVA